MTLTEAELVSWGKEIGRTVETPVFLALRGPLGAGKSVLARAIARGAGVVGPLPSPTFNLLFRYRSARAIEVVHVDLYRLNSPAELRELGWDELGEPGELVIVEWPERAAEQLPPDRWDVMLDHCPGEPGRRSVSVLRVGCPPVLPELRASDAPNVGSRE